MVIVIVASSIAVGKKAMGMLVMEGLPKKHYVCVFFLNACNHEKLPSTNVPCGTWRTWNHRGFRFAARLSGIILNSLRTWKWP